MDIRSLTPDYAVSPQITPEDIPRIKAAGFTRIIGNRPDSEVTPDVSTEAIRAAAEAAGLDWVSNPVSGSGMTPENVATQGEATSEAGGPVFAYCRSGTRSAIVWAFSQAGKIPVDMLIEAGARGGYDLSPYRAQLEAAASQHP